MHEYCAVSMYVFHSAGYGQVCIDVAHEANLFILPNASYCVNCPYINETWTIELLSVDTFVSTIEYTIFSNNSLLMRRSVAGTYQCGNIHPMFLQFEVIFASIYLLS